MLPLAVAIVWAPVIVLVPEAWRLLAHVLGNMMTAVAAGLGLMRHRPTGLRAWVLLWAGNVTAAAGTLIEWVTRVGGAQLPAGPPPVAAACYAVAYVLLCSGYLRLLRARTRVGDPTRLLDALIYSAALMLMLWFFLLQPQSGSLRVGSGEWVVALAVPAANVFIGLLLFRLLLIPFGGNVALRLVALGMGLVVVTDFARLMLTHLGLNPSLSLVGYFIAVTLWAAAMLHPDVHRAAAPTTTSTSTSALRFWLLALAGAAAPAVYAVQEIRGGNANDDDALVLGSFLLYGLFAARLWFTIATLKRSRRQVAVVAEREQVLARAATALLSAQDEDAVQRLSAAAAGAMTGDGPDGGAAVLFGDSDERLPPALAFAAEDIASGADATGPGQIEQALEALTTATSLRMQALHAERLLAQSEARFRSVVQYASDGILINDREGCVMYASPSAGRLLGVPVEELQGVSAFGFIDGAEELVRAQEFMERILGTPRQPVTGEFRATHPDGRPRIFSLTVTNLLDVPGVQGLVLNFNDVTDQRDLEATLQRQAETDALTGLGNRTVLRERLETLLTQTADEPFAVLLADLDDFKTINDTLGHDAGDELLMAVARRLRHELRDEDVACRLGGDEFAVVLTGVHEPEAARVAARLHDAISEPLILAGRSVQPNASFGVVLSPDSEPSPRALLAGADLALYAAKAAGKNQVEHYRPGMREDVVARLELKVELQRALQANDIICHYQPIVDMATRRITGAEALVRWRRGDGRLESPAVFLPLAEETGLIVDIGSTVLRQACVEAVRWSASIPGFTMHVNVSARQLERPEFVTEVLEVLAETGLAPQRLLLEITETALMSQFERCCEVLAALREAGVLLAIDDFGTGYSSLSSLHQLPVHALKIDLSFVRNVHEGPEGSAVARAITLLGSSLGLMTIAEGVEQEQQAHALQGIGCSRAQGFLYARPVSAEEFGTQLEADLAAPMNPADQTPQDLAVDDDVVRGLLLR